MDNQAFNIWLFINSFHDSAWQLTCKRNINNMSKALFFVTVLQLMTQVCLPCYITFSLHTFMVWCKQWLCRQMSQCLFAFCIIWFCTLHQYVYWTFLSSSSIVTLFVLVLLCTDMVGATEMTVVTEVMKIVKDPQQNMVHADTMSFSTELTILS